jgi:hypothetical protein
MVADSSAILLVSDHTCERILLHRRGIDYAEFGVFSDQELFTPRPPRLRGKISESFFTAETLLPQRHNRKSEYLAQRRKGKNFKFRNLLWELCLPAALQAGVLCAEARLAISASDQLRGVIVERTSTGGFIELSFG